jgi:hypothetical protein
VPVYSPVPNPYASLTPAELATCRSTHNIDDDEEEVNDDEEMEDNE